MAKNHREVGNNNRVSHGNAPANLPPTQVGLTLAPPHPSVPRYYPNFPHAEPPFQNQQYHDGLAQAQPYSSSHYHRNLNAGGLSPAQQYQYRTFLQTEQSSQNMQYDGHMFPSQYMMERAANSMRASTAGQSHANSMCISTAGQSSGLSDSGYQLSNSHKRRRL